MEQPMGSRVCRTKSCRLTHDFGAKSCCQADQGQVSAPHLLTPVAYASTTLAIIAHEFRFGTTMSSEIVRWWNQSSTHSHRNGSTKSQVEQ